MRRSYLPEEVTSTMRRSHLPTPLMGAGSVAVMFMVIVIVMVMVMVIVIVIVIVRSHAGLIFRH